MLKAFNLLDEPWLPVRYADGRIAEVGLLQLFADAGQIVALAETSPPGLIALYRVLLAITHRALAREHDQWGKSDLARWHAKGLPVEALHAYLEHWRERFYLFHPDWPFMQVAALAEAEETRHKSKPWTQISLASSSGNAPVLFDHSVDTHPSQITAAQAVRHLLGFLQFTPGGLVKTVRDSDKAGPLAHTAAALPMGDTLARTLCLALHPCSIEPDTDLPAWEQPAPPSLANLRAEPTLATGANDRYTRLSRAVLLLPEGDGQHISQLRFAAGCALAEDDHAPDPMANYRMGSNGLVRLNFSEGRAIWRDLSALLPDPSGKHAKPAGVLGYAHRLLGALGQADSWLPVMVLGLTSDQAKLVRWRVDNVALPTCLLEQEDVVELLRAALRDSEALFVGLRQIATSMLAESMPDPKHKDTRARARAMFDNGASAATYFAHLERRLPALLACLAQAGDHHTLWQAAQLHAIAPAWQAACRQLGEGARAIRACAQHEPRYLGLIKPLLPPVTKEATHV